MGFIVDGWVLHEDVQAIVKRLASVNEHINEAETTCEDITEQEKAPARRLPPGAVRSWCACKRLRGTAACPGLG